MPREQGNQSYSILQSAFITSVQEFHCLENYAYLLYKIFWKSLLGLLQYGFTDSVLLIARLVNISEISVSNVNREIELIYVK